MTPTLNSHRHFATTHWSMVLQLGAPRAEDARAALVKLCVRYWYPIYAYLRQCGHSPAIANDITRSFLQHLLQHFQEEGTTRAQGQFRRYLLARLHDFLVGEWSNMVVRVTAPELAEAPHDLESRNVQDNASAESPEQAYQQSFALELMARGFVRLREEALGTGHVEMYDALEPYIAEDPPAGQYEELAQHLGARPMALVVALKRLRQRFRELIDVELADTVSSAEEMLAEQQALYVALSRIEKCDE